MLWYLIDCLYLIRCEIKDFDFKCLLLWFKRVIFREFCGVLLDKNGLFVSCIKVNEEEVCDFY